MRERQKKRTSEEVLSEVWIGVEPTNDGFADQSLTAWVPHRKNVCLIYRRKIPLSIDKLKSKQQKQAGKKIIHISMGVKKKPFANGDDVVEELFFRSHIRQQNTESFAACFLS